MPFAWVRPRIFFGHDGVAIYHIYKNDNWDDGVRSYWYATSPYGSDECDGENGENGENGEFDVRDLPNPNGHDTETHEGQKAVMREAIDAGILTATEE